MLKVYERVAAEIEKHRSAFLSTLDAEMTKFPRASHELTRIDAVVRDGGTPVPEYDH